MLLSGTAKSQIETLTTWISEWPHVKNFLVVLTGPSASGKTILCNQVLSNKQVTELSGLSEKLPKYLERLKTLINVKTVADYVGMTYGKKPEVLVIEDAELSDTQSQKSILSFARSKTMPVICICIDLPEKMLMDVGLHIRLQRPPLDLVAKDLMRLADLKALSEFTLKDAKVLAESCNCDLRQARIELEMLSYGSGTLSFSDRITPNAFELVPKLFSSAVKDACGFILNNVAVTSDHMLPLMVAENYYKAKDLTIQQAARVAGSISLGDTIKEDELSTLFQVTLPCANAKGPLTTRPAYPVLPAKTACIASNKRRLPCSYDLLKPIENRIVKTMQWAPISAVAMEMKSLNMTSITDWEAVRTLAPIGRPAISISPSKKEELIKMLA